jgi:hypothetical protein
VAPASKPVCTYLRDNPVNPASTDMSDATGSSNQRVVSGLSARWVRNVLLNCKQTKGGGSQLALRGYVNVYFSSSGTRDWPHFYKYTPTAYAMSKIRRNSKCNKTSTLGRHTPLQRQIVKRNRLPTTS